MSRDGFSGELRNFLLVDIIQMACVAQRTGCLQVQNAHDLGRVFLVRGRIAHAETSEHDGERALLEMLCWKKGSFTLTDATGAGVRATIEGGWEHVLMEAVRKRDELVYRESADDRRVGELPAVRLVRDLLAEITERRWRERQRRHGKAVALSLGLALALGGAAGGAWWLCPPTHALWEKMRRSAVGWIEPDRHWRLQPLSEARIPAGEFIFHDGERAVIGTYSIDAAEITIWQYAAFVDEVGNRIEFDHPNQPKGKGHTNPDWDAYRRAGFAAAVFHGQRLTPNVPAAYVDWFDAYAYARWRHRRLPTEAEWEKAGRGTSGFQYPWGYSMRIGAANVFSPVRPISGPAEVGTWPLDRSPYGVYDLAGNVSEWTASFDQAGDPVVKGGNFRSENADLSRRVLRLDLLTRDGRLGFRTVGE